MYILNFPLYIAGRFTLTLENLSRMMGNYQVRFLGDKGGVIRLSYPTKDNNMKKTLLFGLVLISSCNLKNANEKNNLEYRNALINELKFVKANTQTISEEDTVKTMFEGSQYTLFPNGKIEILKPNNHIVSLKLDTKEIIEEAYFYSYKNNFIVFYTETDYDCSGSFVECFEKDSYKLQWKNEIGGFNLSNPIILDSLCYVASIGFVGKLNLNSGKYFWKHDDLYEKTKFNSFHGIEFKNNYVHFLEGKSDVDNKEPGRVLLNDETGEIKEIIKNVR